MKNQQESDEVPSEVTDAIEVDEFVPTLDRSHHDQHVRYTHQLPEDDAEATSRALVRVVPLAYGGLLGGLSDNLLLGLSGGVALSAAFDLYMGRDSVVRALFKSACRAIAAASQRLADAIARRGLKVPSALRAMRCGVSQP
jgi:hypothetical protein